VKKTITVAALTLAAVVAFAAYAEAKSKVEEPKYQITQNLGKGVEIRQYGPRIAAEVEVTGSLDEARNSGFRTLAAYIFGKNIPASKVAMTAPVSAQAIGVSRDQAKIPMTAPVTVQDDHGVWRIRFYMPAAYTMETIPKPSDPRIKLIELKGEKLAVIRFSGTWNDDNFKHKETELKSLLAEKNITYSGDAIKAHYNPPWTPTFLRRNEVLLTVN
jgi:hypothetical protein